MTQVDNIQPSNLNAIHILQTILSLMANSPQLNAITPTILFEATKLGQATSAFYVVFNDAQDTYTHNLSDGQVPDAEWLLEKIRDIKAGVHISNQIPEQLRTQYKGWLLMPIIDDEIVIGLVALLYVSDVSLSENEISLLSSFVDMLTVITKFENAATHHLKLTRNQNEFVRVVSHDLRSPLTSMKGFASMLEDIEQDDKKRHFVTKILNGVTQMTSLVDNIQDAGRYDPETGFYEMERAPADLSDMLYEIVRTHLVPAEKGEVTLTVDIAYDIPIVNVDINMIERSIINLVDNAIKFTPNGGRIEVGLHKEDNNLIITVTDNGYGISEENMEQLFQRHFRIRRREHSRVKGSGLGLFIVRSVARHHSGDAFVRSVEGEGSTFGIWIPLAGENLIGGTATRID